MFKSKITVSVMLAGAVCGSVFISVIECVHGSEACVAWSYTALMGIIALSAVVILMVIRRGKTKKNESGK